MEFRGAGVNLLQLVVLKSRGRLAQQNSAEICKNVYKRIFNSYFLLPNLNFSSHPDSSHSLSAGISLPNLTISSSKITVKHTDVSLSHFCTHRPDHSCRCRAIVTFLLPGISLPCLYFLMHLKCISCIFHTHIDCFSQMLEEKLFHIYTLLILTINVVDNYYFTSIS